MSTLCPAQYDVSSSESDHCPHACGSADRVIDDQRYLMGIYRDRAEGMLN
ncbi:MAG: hypothetical protein V9E81_10910 [Marmoricola sp.]